MKGQFLKKYFDKEQQAGNTEICIKWKWCQRKRISVALWLSSSDPVRFACFNLLRTFQAWSQMCFGFSSERRPNTIQSRRNSLGYDSREKTNQLRNPNKMNKPSGVIEQNWNCFLIGNRSWWWPVCWCIG